MYIINIMELSYGQNSGVRFFPLLFAVLYLLRQQSLGVNVQYHNYLRHVFPLLFLRNSGYAYGPKQLCIMFKITIAW